MLSLFTRVGKIWGIFQLKISFNSRLFVFKKANIQVCKSTWRAKRNTIEKNHLFFKEYLKNNMEIWKIIQRQTYLIYIVSPLYIWVKWKRIQCVHQQKYLARQLENNKKLNTQKLILHLYFLPRMWKRCQICIHTTHAH